MEAVPRVGIVRSCQGVPPSEHSGLTQELLPGVEEEVLFTYRLLLVLTNDGAAGGQSLPQVNSRLGTRSLRQSTPARLALTKLPCL